jgi:hypothetical protein
VSGIAPLRSLFAISFGFSVAGGLIEFIESVGEVFFPLPPTVDSMDIE